ncbi:hypothetical protein [Schnuerera sp.]|uniref:hypothetical protein n=1 Tax=Schnuerera sp. TaxID=2794844 RepID=UPI002C47F976|nr:hypothetical protein [Schnuerera sp.]HSH35737.1 hypothetical protein [Schnuerera sp.]
MKRKIKIIALFIVIMATFSKATYAFKSEDIGEKNMDFIQEPMHETCCDNMGTRYNYTTRHTRVDRPNSELNCRVDEVRIEFCTGCGTWKGSEIIKSYYHIH